MSSNEYLMARVVRFNSVVLSLKILGIDDVEIADTKLYWLLRDLSLSNKL